VSSWSSLRRAARSATSPGMAPSGAVRRVRVRRAIAPLRTASGSRGDPPFASFSLGFAGSDLQSPASPVGSAIEWAREWAVSPVARSISSDLVSRSGCFSQVPCSFGPAPSTVNRRVAGSSPAAGAEISLRSRGVPRVGLPRPGPISVESSRAVTIRGVESASAGRESSRPSLESSRPIASTSLPAGSRGRARPGYFADLRENRRLQAARR
jgi:hypothetical protein